MRSSATRILSEAAVSAAAAHELSTARVLEATVGSAGRARNAEANPSGASGVGAVHRDRVERAARHRRLSPASRSIGQNLDDAANRRVPIQRSARTSDRFDTSNGRSRHDRPVDEPRFDVRHRHPVDQQADVFGLAPAKESARGHDGSARVEIRPRHVEAGQKPKNFRRMCGGQRDERRVVEDDTRCRDESSWCLAAFGSHHDLRVEPRRVGRRSLVSSAHAPRCKRAGSRRVRARRCSSRMSGFTHFDHAWAGLDKRPVRHQRHAVCWYAIERCDEGFVLWVDRRSRRRVAPAETCAVARANAARTGTTLHAAVFILLLQ